MELLTNYVYTIKYHLGRANAVGYKFPSVCVDHLLSHIVYIKGYESHIGHGLL